MADLYEHYGPGAREELDCVPAKQGSTYISVTLVESCMYTVADGPSRVLRLDFDDEFSLLPEEQRAAHIDEWCAVELETLLDELPCSVPAPSIKVGVQVRDPRFCRRVEGAGHRAEPESTSTVA